MVSKYRQYVLWFCHKARMWVWRTYRRMDGQNYDLQDRAIALLRRAVIKISKSQLTDSYSAFCQCGYSRKLLNVPVSLLWTIAMFVCVTGGLYDVTESYSSSFIVAGGLLILAGLVCVPLRRVDRWQLWRRKRRRTEQQQPTSNIVRNAIWTQCNSRGFI